MATAQPVFHKEEESKENEIDHIDPSQDLVSFKDVDQTYVVGEDIPLTYNLGSECRPSSKDWVGLYPRHWTSTKDYVSFEWAPKFPKDYKRPHQRSVLFKATDLEVRPSEETRYQFLYLTKHSQIVGVSTDFSFVPSTTPRPGDSFTLLTDSSFKSSSHGFEIIGRPSNSSLGCLDSDWSDVCLNELFSESDDFRLLYDVTATPLKRASSSDYHLDWLFNDEQEEAQDEETVESSIASDILFEPKQETSNSIDIFQCLNDICDGQWGDMFLQVLEEEADRAQRAASPETAVVLYQPHQIVPYHNTDILPYTPPGPLVLYEPPRSLVLYDWVETEKKTEEKAGVEEALLTPISTRRFSPTEQQIQKLLSSIGPMNMTISQPEQERARPSMELVPTSDPSVATRTAASLAAMSRRALRKRSKKNKCLKCVKKTAMLKRNKKVRASGELLVAGLQRCLEQSDKELAVQATVLEDLGKQVKDITHDNAGLKAINNDLRRKVAERQSTAVQKEQDEQRWLEQALQACQQENQDIKQRCEFLKDKLARMKESHAENEKNRQLEMNQRTARHLSTIASQETTINSLSRECNRLLEQLQEGRRQKEEFERVYKESCKTSDALSARINKLKTKIDEQPTGDMLSERLTAERQKRQEMTQRTNEERRALQEQIRSLQTALQESRLANEQQKPCIACRQTNNGIAPGGPHPLDLSIPSIAVKKSKRTTYRSATSQTSGVETNSKTAQTCPTVDNPVTSQITSMNCDPAVIKVGAVSRFSRHGPLQPTSSDEQEATSGHSSFFASGMEFFSGISKTLTETFADEFLPPTSMSEQHHAGFDSEGTSALDNDTTADSTKEDEEPRARSWADWVEEEEQEDAMAASQWVPDFMASWRPKSGKKASRATGSGVRFDERDHKQPVQNQNQRKQTNRSSPGYKGYGRRHLRKE